MAKNLIQYFGSIEDLYHKLGLTELSPPTIATNLLEQKEDKAKQLETLQQVLSQEKYNAAIQTLREMFAKHSIKRKVEPLLLQLCATGYQQLQLYKQIIQLREDVPLTISSPVTIKTADGSPSITTTTASASVAATSSVLISDPVTITASSSSFSALQSTKELRYRGEERFQQKDLEKQLIDNLSTSLSIPLQFLRQSYHKLDRD